MIKSYPKAKKLRIKGHDKKKNLQKEVLVRDDFSCRRCGAWVDDEPPHHLQYNSHGVLDVLENMISLCRPCHDAIHHNGYLRAYGPESQLEFSLTVSGKIAVENGKLRKEI